MKRLIGKINLNTHENFLRLFCALSWQVLPDILERAPWSSAPPVYMAHASVIRNIEI
jgi:hypothetical protein